MHILHAPAVCLPTSACIVALSRTLTPSPWHALPQSRALLNRCTRCAPSPCYWASYCIDIRGHALPLWTFILYTARSAYNPYALVRRAGPCPSCGPAGRTHAAATNTASAAHFSLSTRGIFSRTGRSPSVRRRGMTITFKNMLRRFFPSRVSGAPDL